MHLGCRSNRYPFSDTQPIELPDWQRYIRDMAMNIITEQSPRRYVATGEDAASVGCDPVEPRFADFCCSPLSP